MKQIFVMTCVLLASALLADAPKGVVVQGRVDEDVAAGKPIVAHVIVALCDNVNQGIVPVPASLGDGQNPHTNLYWGAAYGLRTFFKRRPEYEFVQASWEHSPSVLDTAVFRGRFDRTGKMVDLIVVAEAWNGNDMTGALSRFLRLAAGHDPVDVNLRDGELLVNAGGDSVLVAFVGHNGLMEMQPPTRPKPRPGVSARCSIVLACASRQYFLELLRRGGSQPSLLTNGLMAPEAYTLEAAFSAFASGAEPPRIREAAATAYDRYQKCGRRAALRLFSSEP